MPHKEKQRTLILRDHARGTIPLQVRMLSRIASSPGHCPPDNLASLRIRSGPYPLPRLPPVDLKNRDGGTHCALWRYGSQGGRWLRVSVAALPLPFSDRQFLCSQSGGFDAPDLAPGFAAVTSGHAALISFRGCRCSPGSLSRQSCCAIGLWPRTLPRITSGPGQSRPDRSASLGTTRLQRPIRSCRAPIVKI